MSDPAPRGAIMRTFFSNLCNRVVDVRAEEVRAMWLAFVFNFVVLGGYYVIRPIRDEIGASSGVEKLPWMFTAVLITMLAANAVFAAIVARMSRRRFIPIAYRFFIANLVMFIRRNPWTDHHRFACASRDHWSLPLNLRGDA